MRCDEMGCDDMRWYEKRKEKIRNVVRRRRGGWVK